MLEYAYVLLFLLLALVEQPLASIGQIVVV